MSHPQGKRVVMAVINDIETDQRVHRSCITLHEAGWQVLLMGRMLPDSKPLHRPYGTCRMRLLFRKGGLFYAEYNIRLFFKLLFAHADLFYANDTDTLPATWLAARLRRKSLFFDAHELFPEVPELVSRPRVKRVWQKIEDFFFPRLCHYPCGAACCTVCQSIADYYKQRYHLDMSVVRNVPLSYNVGEVVPISVKTLFGAAAADGNKSLLLYQGAVNVGRGLELLVDSMPYLDDCLLLVVGTGDIINELRARVRERKVDDRVKVTGRVMPQALRSYTVCADLGMSLLAHRGLSYYYSFPNRIADFAQAGVPVLATDFPEIHRIVETYHIGTLVSEAETDPQKIAAIIRQTLREWRVMPPEEKIARFGLARQELCWTKDKAVLLAAVCKAVKGVAPTC